MAKTVETGHVKNVANFELLLNICTGFGSSYNPSKQSISIEEITQKFNVCRGALNLVMLRMVEFNTATNQRQELFEKMKPLCTQLVNAFSITNATARAIEDVKAINRKIQGNKSKSKNGNTLSSTDDGYVSTVQQSYDQRTENFAQLLTYLSSESTYTPNETHLRIGTLENYLNDLRRANTNTSNAQIALTNSRRERNELLYNTENGLCYTAQEIKKYVKAVFGATSPQYKQLSSIAFKIYSI